MTFDEVIKGRRSIRIYTEEKVPYELIERIVEAGVWAPSACNKQDSRFIYFDNNKDIRKIFDLGAAHFLKDCNQAILVLYDNRIDNVEYMDNLQSASAVIENMILKAYDLGVASCWICNLPSKAKLRKLLNIPSHYDPIAMVSLGYAKNKTAEMPRKYDYRKLIHINKFDLEQDCISEKKSKGKILIRKYLRKVYLILPKTKLLKKMVDKFEKKFQN